MLRWTEVAQARQYVLRILKPTGEPLLVKEELTEPRFVIPADALAELNDDGTFLWQVEAVLKDGTRILSPTFQGKIEVPREKP